MKFKNIICILFDLDGVLIDGQPLQVKSTIEVLKNYTQCTNEVKLLVNETITTKEKLQILNSKGLIKKKDINKIYSQKIKLFEKIALKKIKCTNRVLNMFKKLNQENFKVGVVTNSNGKTAIKILKKLKIFKFLDILISNSNKIKPKPNPEPYNLAMAKLKAKKKNTLIFEDSPVGILSAKRSGANYYKIRNLNKLNFNFLTKIIKFNHENL